MFGIKRRVLSSYWLIPSESSNNLFHGHPEDQRIVSALRPPIEVEDEVRGRWWILFDELDNGPKS